MKKTLTILIALTMLLSVSACGNSESQQPTDSAISSSQVSQTEGSSETAAQSSGTKLSGTYKVPMKNIYVDVPSYKEHYKELEKGYTELFIIHDSRYVAVTSDRRNDTVKSAKEAHDPAFSKLKLNLQDYEGGMNSLNITKDEETTINGIDMYLFEGTINYGTDTKFDGYAKGCAFILEGIPCEIVGSVIDKSQSQELIDEISEIVDEMTQTVRSEE